MRVTNTSAIDPTLASSLSATFSGEKANQKIASAQAGLDATKQLGKSFNAMEKAAAKLQNPSNFKSASEYSAALKDFTTAYNQTREQAKGLGTEGKQALAATDRIARALKNGAAQSGFNVDKDGTLSVDATKAEATFKNDGAKATATFSAGVGSKLTDASRPINSAIDHKVKKYQADIEETTRQQVMLNKVTAQLSQTYGGQGQLVQQTGPTSIYQLL